MGLGEWSFAGCPVVFWDVFGKQGHPVRATVSEMGPLLLSRILNLNDTQTGVLTLVFKIADDSGLLLLDMKDMQAMLQHVGKLEGVSDAIWKYLGGEYRCDSTWVGGVGAAGRGSVLWRAGTEY